MYEQPSAAKLTDEVLDLYPSILKVFLLEARAGRLVVVEESVRPGFEVLPHDVDQALMSGTLDPLPIFDAAAQFNANLGVPKLVGILYRDTGLILAHITSFRLLAICVEVSGFHEVLQILDKALPNLMIDVQARLMPVNYVRSAAEATEIARNYVAAVGKSPEVSVDEVALNQEKRIWEIRGSHRTFPFARSRRFQLQIGTQNGVVMGFFSTPRPSLAPLLAGIIVILGTLLFLVWFLFLNS